MNADVSELVLLRRLTAGFGRSPAQRNAHQESDAELVRLPGRRGVLAVTTDVVAEEIEAGLYVDPHQIGWMTVLVNASDLAAVGAKPIGILITETLPRGIADDVLTRLQAGIAAASDACGLPVLGGDTNLGAHLQLGGTAVGWIPGGRVMTRRGAAAGDRLYASAPLGGGGLTRCASCARGPGREKRCRRSCPDHAFRRGRSRDAMLRAPSTPATARWPRSISWRGSTAWVSR